MRLLDTTQLELKEFVGGTDIPKYAILSHTWGDDEVTYGMMGKSKTKKMKGYSKIMNACRQAHADGYKYIWIDTCCIDKSSSTELSEAINSMFAWYRDADVCYAYLADVEQKPDPAPLHDKARAATIFRAFPGDVTKTAYVRELLSNEKKVQRDQFSASRWFTRGWTLQELIAPSEVIFYSRNWREIARKSQSYDKIAHVTGIDTCYLSGDLSIMRASIAERMFWASSRSTTRPEDIAYCLLGIFDVNMPLLYGEGQKAFLRLQEEILRYSDDHTLFAWQRKHAQVGIDSSDWQGCGILAQHPIDFRDSKNIVPYASPEGDGSVRITNTGLELTLRPAWGKAQPTEPRRTYALNCTIKPSCEDSVTIDLRPVHDSPTLHVRFEPRWMGRSHHPRTDGIRLCVSTNHAEHLPRRIWPRAELHLKRGPTFYPLVNVVSLQYRLRPDTGELIPYLDQPPRPDSHTRPPSPTSSSTSERTSTWIPEKLPIVYQMPRGDDLIAVALEFALPANLRMIFMLGTSSKYDVGFDCMLLHKTNKMKLQDCGTFYNPHKFGYLVFEPEGYRVRVWGESTFTQGVYHTNGNIAIRDTKADQVASSLLSTGKMSMRAILNRVEETRRRISDDIVLHTSSTINIHTTASEEDAQVD